MKSVTTIVFLLLSFFLFTGCKNSSNDHRAQLPEPKRDGIYHTTAYAYDVSCPQETDLTLIIRGRTIQEYQMPEANIEGEVTIHGFDGVIEGLDQPIFFQGWYDGRNITGDWEYADGECTGWFTGVWEKLP